MLSIEIKAPDFTLRDKDGEEVKLSPFLGRKMILYFYSEDNMSGCTREACAFAGVYIRFKQRNVEAIGVSRGSERSCANFATEYGLPFILLPDPEPTITQAYDMWKEKKFYGKISTGVVRSTHVIDENGVIEEVFEKVKPDANAQEMLDYLDGKTEQRNGTSNMDQ